MQVKAHLKHLNISPRKVRMVVDTVRGSKAVDALISLDFVKNKSAQPISKLIKSAIANAENNFLLDKNDLKISSITVDGGPFLKRFRPRAFGRAGLIRHRSSHITVVLEGERKIQKTEKESGLGLDKEKAPTPEDRSPDSSDDVRKEDKTISKPIHSRDFEIDKKAGQDKKPSFGRRIFRRKSI